MALKKIKPTMKFSELSQDIIIHIYSFGDPKHRILMKDICKKIGTNHKKINKRLINYYNNYGREEESLFMFIRSRFSRPDILNMFKYYKKCHCCTRHCHYKPDILKQEFNIKPQNSNDYSDNSCKCQCRHISRHLYLAYC